MKLGIKVSLGIAIALIFMYVTTKCLSLISAKNDFYVISGIIGLLIILTIVIAIIVKNVKIIQQISKKERAK
jgi:hypothetical protein